MSRWKELGFSEADMQELKSVRNRLGMDNRGDRMPNDMPIAPSKEELSAILRSCAAMMGFEMTESEE